mmetsp:Transcript_52597/g.157603  ORF Transcript_52597/g.157603 Transcript_52597/m.157603 type:complete len:292 (-) Transcript_52597:1000-1875(-)
MAIHPIPPHLAPQQRFVYILAREHIYIAARSAEAGAPRLPYFASSTSFSSFSSSFSFSSAPSAPSAFPEITALAMLLLLLVSRNCSTVASPSMDALAMKDWVGVRSVRRLVRTMKFSGMRNRLYIAALLSSGTMAPFMVPIMGQYMPTHISNTFMLQKVTVSELEVQMTAMAMDETRKTPMAMTSPRMRSTRIEKRDEPAMQHTMKVEKMRPKGSDSDSLSSSSFFVREVRAGVHMKTNMYMDPSKSEDIVPHSRMSVLRQVTTDAFLSASYQRLCCFPESSPSSSPEVSP